MSPPSVAADPNGTVAWAKAVLAGTRTPTMPSAPDMAAAQLERLAGGSADPGVPSEARDTLLLQACYGGHTVACCRAADGSLAVLAVGAEQIGSLHDHLSDDELERVWLEYPRRSRLTHPAPSPPPPVNDHAPSAGQPPALVAATAGRDH